MRITAERGLEWLIEPTQKQIAAALKRRQDLRLEGPHSSRWLLPLNTRLCYGGSKAIGCFRPRTNQIRLNVLSFVAQCLGDNSFLPMLDAAHAYRLYTGGNTDIGHLLIEDYNPALVEKALHVEGTMSTVARLLVSEAKYHLAKGVETLKERGFTVKDRIIDHEISHAATAHHPFYFDFRLKKIVSRSPQVRAQTNAYTYLVSESLAIATEYRLAHYSRSACHNKIVWAISNMEDKMYIPHSCVDTYVHALRSEANRAADVFTAALYDRPVALRYARHARTARGFLKLVERNL